MSQETQNPYSSPEEMAQATGLTVEEAARVLKSWAYRQPQDPEKRLAHAREGSRYEHEMRGLNTDRADGRITEQEYQKRAEEIAMEHRARLEKIASSP